MQKSDFHEPPYPSGPVGFTSEAEAYYPNCICYEIVTHQGWADLYHLRYRYATLHCAHTACWKTAQGDELRPAIFLNSGRQRQDNQANQSHMELIKVLDSIRKYVLWYCDHSDYIHKNGIARMDTETWSITLEGVKEIRTTMPYRVEGV